MKKSGSAAGDDALHPLICGRWPGEAAIALAGIELPWVEAASEPIEQFFNVAPCGPRTRLVSMSGRVLLQCTSPDVAQGCRLMR
jgi:hypothetical protein